MRMIRSCRAVLFLIVLAATPLLAQEPICAPSDTMTTCLRHYLKPETYRKEMEAQEWNALESMPTGVDTGGINLTTTTRDFSPLMALSGLLGQNNADKGTGTIVYNLNFLIPWLGKETEGARNGQFQAVVNMQPQISGLVRNAIPAAERDDRVSQLEEKLGILDDYTIHFTYNYSNLSHGRRFAQYKNAYEAMCDIALGAVDWQKDDQTLSGRPDIPEDTTFENMTPMNALKARMFVQAKASELRAQADRAMSAAGLKSYHQLVNNQPQFHVTAERKFREPLVGPDELSLNVTYEWTMVNLNAATKGCVNWDETCLDRYTEYVDSNEGAIEDSNRVSFSGKYVDIEGETINAGLANPIVSGSARRLELSLGWGRNLTFGGEPVKLDLSATYENVSDDPKRKDRGIARLTLTRSVGMMSIPFGIVYANHGEFLGDVDARLSAHFGLTFKMPDMSGGQ